MIQTIILLISNQFDVVHYASLHFPIWHEISIIQILYHWIMK